MRQKRAARETRMLVFFVQSIRDSLRKVVLIPYVAVLLLGATFASHAQSSSPWNRRDELKKAGYTELSGVDAIRLLVGNSVIVPENDGKDGLGIINQKQIYYFLDERRVYVCGTAGATECVFGSWSV